MKYHRDVYLPSAVEQEARVALTKYAATYYLTGHAQDKCLMLGVTVPRPLPLNAEIVEVTRGEKCLVRFPNPWNSNAHLVVSLNYRGGVCTVFVNHRADHHRTLDVSQYIQRAK